MGTSTVYYVLEFPDASGRDEFIRSVKIRRFRLLKDIHKQYGFSNYKIKQAIRNDGSVGSNLYIEKFTAYSEIAPGEPVKEPEVVEYKPSFEMSFD